MIWFAWHLRALPLEALMAGCSKLPSSPLQTQATETPHVVIEDRRVITVSPAAADLGVEVGMNFAAASSLAPELQPWPRDPQREVALMKRLALALLHYSPSVVLQQDTVLIEVSASLRLFGGARLLAKAMLGTVRNAGVDHLSFAAAPTAAAASVLARVDPTAMHQPRAIAKPAAAARRKPSMPNRLDALPLPAVLQAWGQSTALTELLHGIGCRTLGDVRRLPRTGLKRRGGQGLMDRVERTYGDAPDPQTWYEGPPNFELGIELLHRADNAAALVFAAQRLAQPLVGWLTQRWLAATRVSLRMKHQTEHRRARDDTVLTLTLGEPSREAAQIMLLLRERLQRLTLPAPTYALVLNLDESVSHAGRACNFWHSGAAQHEGEIALIDRLSARLGAERVQRALLHADHRPEHAMAWITAQNHPLQASASKHDAGSTGLNKPTSESLSASKPVKSLRSRCHPLRPSWLLKEPLALPEQDDRPWHQGAPLHIVSRAERIEAGWFDGALASRDYHLAVGADQRCVWVYRERRADQASRWFLHGIFG